MTCCGKCSIEDSGSSANIRLSNIYPGWSGIVLLLLRNDGSVPAKVGSNGVSIVTGGALGNYLRVRNIYVFGPFTCNFHDISWRVSSGKLKFPKPVTLPVVLEPEEFIVIAIRLHLSSSAPYGASGSLVLTVDSGPFNA